MKRILVTGGAGFIGSHLTEILLDRGHRVTVVDDESTGSVENLSRVRDNPNLTYIRDTVMDEEVIRRTVPDADEVYHLAAVVGVARVEGEPIDTIETNVYPTQLILGELKRLADRGKFVRFYLASTSEVYGKNPNPPWKEEDDLVFGATTGARWAYGASKAIDEFLALAYWREHKVPVVIGRFFNVTGPRQTGAFGMVLPRFVDAALSGRQLVVHNDGQQVRCFSHVQDVITYVLGLMDTDAALGRVFNIGNDQPVTILELARRVIEMVNPSLEIEFRSYEQEYGQQFGDILHRVPDLTRLRQTVDHRPKMDLDAIIGELVEMLRAKKD